MGRDCLDSFQELVAALFTALLTITSQALIQK